MAMADPPKEPTERKGEATRAALAALRHEMGQPLTVIQGFSELICGGELSHEEVLEYAAEIFKEATHLAELVARTRDLDRPEGKEEQEGASGGAGN